MVKKIEWRVVCPDCVNVQTYHSHNTEVEGKRRKSCEKCGRSFKAKQQRLSNLPKVQKQLRKEKEKKGEGFHKYSRG